MFFVIVYPSFLQIYKLYKQINMKRQEILHTLIHEFSIQKFIKGIRFAKTLRLISKQLYQQIAISLRKNNQLFEALFRINNTFIYISFHLQFLLLLFVSQSMETALKQHIHQIDPHVDLENLQSIKELFNELNFVQGDFPKKFANSLGNLISIADNYAIQLDNSCKYQLFDLIITTVQIYPSVIRKNHSRVDKLFQLICRVMANISESVPAIWFNPTDDYKEDDIEKLQVLDPDHALVCRFRSLMDRISNIFGYSEMLARISQSSKFLYQQGDWRWKNAVLMCLSQLTEDIDIQNLATSLNLIIYGIQDSHPKVRFAAIQALGQISDDLKPGFQDKYFNQFMPRIMNGLNDPIERVSGHWMACMTNFIQDFQATPNILPYIEQLINKICIFVEKGNHTAKQNAISTLSSLVTVPSLFDQNSIRKPFQICHSIFQTFDIKNNLQLINQTLECITIAISSNPILVVKNYIDFTINIMNQLCDQIQGDYFVTGWHRVCSVQYKFQNWTKGFNKVMQIIEELPLSDKKTGLSSLMSTIQCFKQEMFPYAVDIISKIKAILDSALQQGEDDCAFSAIDTISQICIKVKPANPDGNWQLTVRQILESFIKEGGTLLENQKYKISKKFFSCSKQIFIVYFYLYSYEELSQLFLKFIQIVNKINGLKQNIKNSVYNDEQEDEENYLQKKEQDMQDINDCKLQVPQILFEIVKKMPNPLQLVPQILQHTEMSITNAMDNQDLRYSLYYLDDILEYFSYQDLLNYWGLIVGRLTSFCLKQDADLRNAAIFGVGVLVEKIPFEYVSQENIDMWIQASKNCYMMPKKDKQSKKHYGHCQDNCIAVVGKVLKRFGKNFNLKFLYQKWIMALPLKYDPQQNRGQITYLCQVLKQNPQLLIDNSPNGLNNLMRVVKVFGELVCHLRKKKINEKNMPIIQLTRSTIQNMYGWPIFKQNQSSIMQSLTQNQLFHLEKVLSNQPLI